MVDQPRPVWLTRDQAVSIAAGQKRALRKFADAWAEAPADPAKAVLEAMLPIQHHTYDYTEETAAVLKALGMPDE